MPSTLRYDLMNCAIHFPDGVLSPVAECAHRELLTDVTRLLLTLGFWIPPIYSELLYTASRVKKHRQSEVARPGTGLAAMHEPLANGPRMPPALARPAMQPLFSFGCLQVGLHVCVCRALQKRLGFMINIIGSCLQGNLLSNLPREERTSNQPAGEAATVAQGLS